MHQLKTQWTWIWQYICLRHTSQHLDDFVFFPALFSPHNDGSVLPRYQISATHPCCGGRFNPSSRAPTKWWTGDQGWNGNWGNATLLPQTWAKGAKGLKCFSSKNKLKVVLRWFGYLKAGVVISVLGWAMRLLYRKLNVDQHRCWALLTPSTNPNEIYLTGALPGHGRGAFESSYVCRSGEESFSRFWRSSAPAARQGVMQLRRMDEILAMANISVCLLWQCFKHPNWCRIVFQWQLEDLQSFSSLRATPQGLELLR